MNTITHLLASWAVADQTQDTPRDRAIVAWAGVAPDLDGIGIVVDFGTRMLGLPETDLYQSYHRLFGHGLPAAVALTVLGAAAGRNRWRVAIWAFLVIHLHFLCDLVGSRGSTPEDLWPIFYLAPLSTLPTLSWSGQWPLVGWQNMLLSTALLGLTLALGVARGYSIVGLFSRRADTVVVGTLRQRWQQVVRRTARS